MINVKSPLPTLWVWGAFLVAIIDLAVGQRSFMVCNSTAWYWAYNSRNQDPCLVSAYLAAPCFGGQVDVIDIPPATHQDEPNNNSCVCSSVVYSLAVICDACYHGKSPAEADPKKWSEWSATCDSSMISISKYPNVISSFIAVPGWAYFDVVTADRLNIVNASLSGNLPESTVGNLPTSTLSISPPSSNRSTDTSMIIGVVLGGVIGLILLIVLTILLMNNPKGQSSANEDIKALLPAPHQPDPL